MDGPEFSIQLKEMHHLRVIFELAKEHPEHLERSFPTDDEIRLARRYLSTYQAEVEASKEEANKITHGLDTVTLKPVGMKGEALLDHMIQFRKRNNERDLSAK